jgi:hypothetical protein
MGRESRQARRARERREQTQQRNKLNAQSNRRSIIAGGAIALVVLLILAVLAFGRGGGTGNGVTATGTALAISAFTPVPGYTSGPAKCTGNEMVESGFYHVHAHLTMIHNGKPVTLPSQIGFKSACLYWVHTHSPSEGIIHIESPYPITPTLGDFFHIWGVPLSSTGFWRFKGPVRVFVNLKPYTGDPRKITLHLHTDVTLEVGRPFVAPKRFNFGTYGV